MVTSATMNADTQPQRVILVDDSEYDNFFHDIALRKAGFGGEIQVFEKGDDALKFLVEDQIDVPTIVLLDINMPGLCGFELAQELASRLQAKAPVAVYMLSASSWGEDRKRAEKNELIQGMLSKPLTRESAQKLLGFAEHA